MYQERQRMQEVDENLDKRSSMLYKCALGRKMTEMYKRLTKKSVLACRAPPVIGHAPATLRSRLRYLADVELADQVFIHLCQLLDMGLVQGGQLPPRRYR
jgi:hypothetical protein